MHPPINHHAPLTGELDLLLLYKLIIQEAQQLESFRHMKASAQHQDPSPQPKISVDLNFSTSEASINGKVIDYEKQILLSDGLLIRHSQGIPLLPQEYTNNFFIPLNKDLKRFDRHYVVSRFCSEIAQSIDRCTNSAYHILNRAKQNPEGPGSAVSVTFDSAIMFLKKIPKKTKHLVAVLKKLSLHKVCILLEDEAFFLQLFDFINAIHKSCSMVTLSPCEKKSENVQIGKQNDKITDQQGRPQDGKSGKDLTLLKEHVEEHPEFIQRVKILIDYFSFDSILTAYLFQLNKRLLPQLVEAEVQKLFERSSGAGSKKNWADRGAIGCMEKLYACLRTLAVSMASSKVCYQLIRETMLTTSVAEWLRENFKIISAKSKGRQLLVNFYCLACEVEPAFVSSIFHLCEPAICVMVDEEMEKASRIRLDVERGPRRKTKQGSQNENCILQKLIQIGTKIVDFSECKKCLPFTICSTYLEFKFECIRSTELQSLTLMLSSNKQLRDSVYGVAEKAILRQISSGQLCLRYSTFHLVEITNMIRMFLGEPNEARIRLAVSLLEGLNRQKTLRQNKCQILSNSIRSLKKILVEAPSKLR